MNAVKRQRPNISPDDIERLPFHLEDARNYIVKYSAAEADGCVFASAGC